MGIAYVWTRLLYSVGSSLLVPALADHYKARINGSIPARTSTVPRTCDLLIKSQLLYQLSYRVPDIVPVLSPLGDVFVPDHCVSDERALGKGGMAEW